MVEMRGTAPRSSMCSRCFNAYKVYLLYLKKGTESTAPFLLLVCLLGPTLGSQHNGQATQEQQMLQDQPSSYQSLWQPMGTLTWFSSYQSK